jgi:hypothetical protein
VLRSATAEEPDVASAPPPPAAAAAGASERMNMDAPAAGSGIVPRGKASLRRYVEAFDAETLAETARIVSLEGVALVERQTTGLFGSIEALSRQMQEAIGQDVTSREDFMLRMRAAIDSGAVDSITLPYAQQRRVVLEAVAFGSFMRDVEGRVGAEHALLTPVAGSR